MQDFLELAQSRQSCRKFADKPVEKEKLLKCIEAARMAPSACNSQPWSFVVAHSPEIVAEVAKCGQQMGINGFLDKAGAIILVLEEHAVLMPKLRCMLDSQYFAKTDIGGATLSICLEAVSQGLGVCIIGMYDREKLCQLLDLPPNKRFASFIAVGYPESETVLVKTRKPLDDLVRFV